MSDVVSEKPRSITIGPSEDTTFTTPDLGLPAGFAIVSPGMRGHVLTLAHGMRGTICVEGVEHDVAHLVRDGFHATAISGLDWGVVELDTTGKLKIFFQFVGRDNVPVKPLFEQEPEQRASLAFSTLLHGALLFTTYQLYTHTDSDVDPTRDLTAQYVVTRIEPSQPAIAVPAVTVDHTVKVATPMPTSTWREPIAKAPPKHGATRQDITDGPPPPASVFDGKTQKLFDEITQKRNGVGRLGEVVGQGGPPGGAPEVGPTTKGDGKGDGKQPHGDYKGGPDQLQIGGMRKGTLCTGTDCGGEPATVIPTEPPNHDDNDTLTEMDIRRVIDAARRQLTTCYQKEVNRDPNLAGTVHMRFEISAAGTVSNVKVASTTLRSDAVTQCLSERIAFLHFPAKGRAVVNYPFVFSAR